MGEGLTDLCKLMILQPGEPDYSPILYLLYDISSRIKVDPSGDTDATLKDIIDIIAAIDTPALVSNIILKMLEDAKDDINDLLGKSAFLLFCS